jgi:hypothetical protein
MSMTLGSTVDLQTVALSVRHRRTDAQDYGLTNRNSGEEVEMEHNRRHMTAVASFDEKNVRRAHNEAVALFGGLVSSVVTGNADRYQAFSVGCDGSFVVGDCCNCAGARHRFHLWLRAAETDGPTLDWVEVKYNDESGSLAVMASSDPSNLTFDGVAVLAAILGLPVGQLLPDLCAIRALYGTDTVGLKGSYLEEELLLKSHNGQRLLPLLGSARPVSTGHLALELPPGQAFEAARLVADYFQTPCPLVDPITRVLSGVAFPTFPPSRRERQTRHTGRTRAALLTK